MTTHRPIELIVNPASGRGRASSLARQAESAFRAAGVPLTGIRMSQSLADLAAATRRAADQGSIPVILGGDGSVRAAVQALAESAGFSDIETPLGLLPAGTGNDVLRAMDGHQFPRALRLLIDAWQSQQTHPLDAALVEVPRGPQAGTHVSLLIWGAGLAAEVARLGSRLRWLGPLAYAAGGAACLVTHRPFEATLTIDGQELDGCWDLLAVSTCPYVGGGMHIAPGLRLDDGRMQWLTARIPGNLKLLGSMTGIFKGRHRHADGVRVGEGRNVHMRTRTPIPMNLDGDVFEADEAALSLRPAFFRLLFPSGPQPVKG